MKTQFSPALQKQPALKAIALVTKPAVGEGKVTRRKDFTVDESAAHEERSLLLFNKTPNRNSNKHITGNSNKRRPF